ncbi:Protease Do-like 8, chloroplastic [Sesamum angolense]|uniref:Protease Do-like 8, chloroplastic n=1 Tax=Sesamum angolense TaxID=2727404 RepID=A0AAE1WGW9_9LAMI|nr:Protease Do-like 8, chloroplastic [Sesamum angolense]
MQAIVACSSSAIPPLKSRKPITTFISGQNLPFLGRRKLCCDVVSRLPIPSTRWGDDKEDMGGDCLQKIMQDNFALTTRRSFFTPYALGDPSVTIEQVTPQVLPAGALFPSEERIVKLFEKNTYSVVNIFDVTLRPQLNITGAVEVPEGNGSGVVWDEQGHIVTNYHVIGNSLSRNPSTGQIVARVNILASEGTKKASSLLILQSQGSMVEAPKELLRPIKVGPSSSLKVGQQCLAIGNPFGFDHTLTVGVISGLNRDINSRTGVTIGGGIQTDAAINPGNSGGPLLDSKGNLIGINTAIFTQTGTSAGVGFAIPSSTVVKIVPQLIQFGKVLSGPQYANGYTGSWRQLAAKAGLLPTTRGFAGNIVLGDIILAVDDKPARNRAELYKIFDEYIL